MVWMILAAWAFEGSVTRPTVIGWRGDGAVAVRWDYERFSDEESVEKRRWVEVLHYGPGGDVVSDCYAVQGDPLDCDATAGWDTVSGDFASPRSGGTCGDSSVVLDPMSTRHASPVTVKETDDGWKVGGLGHARYGVGRGGFFWEQFDREFESEPYVTGFVGTQSETVQVSWSPTCAYLVWERTPSVPPDGPRDGSPSAAEPVRVVMTLKPAGPVVAVLGDEDGSVRQALIDAGFGVVRTEMEPDVEPGVYAWSRAKEIAAPALKIVDTDAVQPIDPAFSGEGIDIVVRAP